MNWDMEIEEIEAVLEKIWDLHDKLSDAIHAVSRTHFLNSIKTLKRSDKKKPPPPPHHHHHQPFNDVADEPPSGGFVFVKDFRGAVDEDDDVLAVSEAKSLNGIRTALENLEEQLEFFHTVQYQQRAERDAAIARLEQSRILLAVRLAEHHGNKYKVIEEVHAFIGKVHDPRQFVSPEHLYSPASSSGQNFESHQGNWANTFRRLFLSSVKVVKRTFKADHMGGVLGNAALIAVSMLALLYMQQIGHKDKFILQHPLQWEDFNYGKRAVKKSSRPENSLSSDDFSHLDVLLARG